MNRPAEVAARLRRVHRIAVVALSAAMIGGLLAAWAYWTDRTDLYLGVGLAVALTGIGVGLIAWAQELDADEEVVQERARTTSTPTERRELHEALTAEEDVGGAMAPERRRLLTLLLSGSVLSSIVAIVGPIGSLGPRPRGERDRTGWRSGIRLVTEDGSPIAAQGSPFDQLATVFPAGQIGRDDSQVVLLRLRPEQLTERTLDGSVDGWVAYSKICTHAGCSVGLFGVDSRPPDTLRQLVCPCHQSVFDPVDAARPVGGPATRRLPQLPVEVDAEGFLVARRDFDRPVGPIAWDEG